MEVRQFDTPYRHFILSGVVSESLIAEARLALPPVDDPHWIRYDNPLERKWAYESYADMPPPWRLLMNRLRSPPLLDKLSDLIGVKLQAPDTVSRGGGLHVMFGGGVLGPHVDYALHPCGLERRANLILFCDAVYGSIGGQLVLGADAPSAAVLSPMRGEAVVWECGDDTFHAVTPLHVACPARVTAACYYLAAPRPGCTRRRALFLPPRSP